jgi:hypothetical protein
MVTEKNSTSFDALSETPRATIYVFLHLQPCALAGADLKCICGIDTREPCVDTITQMRHRFPLI